MTKSRSRVADRSDSMVVGRRCCLDDADSADDVDDDEADDDDDVLECSIDGIGVRPKPAPSLRKNRDTRCAHDCVLDVI